MPKTVSTSDPVALTVTPFPTGTEVADRRTISEEPLVDEVLASVGEDRQNAPSLDHEGELHALQAEIANLKASIGQVGTSSVRLARAHADEALGSTRARIRARPTTAVAIAAAIGFVWGATR